MNKTRTEGQLLDALTLNEAKGILGQLRWFADDTHFLSLRLTDDELNWIQKSHMGYKLSIEELISALCEQDVYDREKKEGRPCNQCNGSGKEFCPHCNFEITCSYCRGV